IFRQNSGKSKSSSVSKHNPFQSRPFTPAPEASPQPQEAQDLEQLKQNALQSKGSGYNFANVNVTPRQTNPLPMLQRKLMIGQPGDKYEQEADKVATDVAQQNGGAQQRLPLPPRHLPQHPVNETPSTLVGESVLQTHKLEASQIGNSNGRTIQRVVDVGGEQNPTVLWKNVQGLVEKVYRRKKTLFEWSEMPPPVMAFTDYPSLAIELDKANQSKASQGRSRPDWTPKIKDYYDKTWGGKRHRRHIIMSSLMRDAVYAVTDNPLYTNQEKLAVYNEIIATAGFAAYDKTDLNQAESALVYVLHNNPANLVIDSGAENSAIGSLAHNFNTYLEKDEQALTKDLAIFKQNPIGFLDAMVSGFQPQVQQQIVDIIKNFPMPTNVGEFREYLEMIYDNTAVDVMTNEKLPPQAPEMLQLHGRFLASQSTGDLNILYGTAMTYVLVGVEFKDCPYSTIW
ncbi:MAG TPA: hypothetical protein V6C95_10190, partial [Coleofasciculaceae cyanobacterium]